MQRATLFVPVAVAVATIGTIPPRSTSGAPTVCVHVTSGVAHYCGRASARLSVFPSAFFRHGSCTRRRVGGMRLLQVRIGAKSLDGSRTNDGLPYFSLGLAGAHSRPKSGNVIAYFHSRRWVGRVGSFKGNPEGGVFVARGIAGSRGRARGRFRC